MPLMIGPRQSIVSPDGRLRVALEKRQGAPREVALLFQLRHGGRWSTPCRMVGNLWPISRTYEDGPAEWVSPVLLLSEKDKSGSLILEGEMELAGHRWRTVDRYSFEQDCIRLDRTWKHLALRKEFKVTLSLQVEVPTREVLALWIPGVLHGETSASKTNLSSPRLDTGSPLLFEEHRLPVPMVTAEVEGGGELFSVSLMAVPSLVRDSSLEDQWWSLGLEERKGALALLSLSGPLASSGKWNLLYAAENHFIPYERAFVNPAPKAIYEKTYYLALRGLRRRSEGFRYALRHARRIFQLDTRSELDLEQVIRLKKKCAMSRFYEDETCAGFLLLPGIRSFGYGTRGASLSIAYGLLAEGLRLEENLPTESAIRAIDFFVKKSPVGKGRGLCFTHYDASKKLWRGAQDARFISASDFGEAISSLADLVALAGPKRRLVRKWVPLLVRSGEFLARPNTLGPGGLYPSGWTPEGNPIAAPSTPMPHQGYLALTALLLCAEVAEEKKWLHRAEEIYSNYSRPDGRLSYGTFAEKNLTATYLGLLLALYRLTKKDEYLRSAEAAAELILSFMYIHDVALPEESPLHNRFCSVGWTTVSTTHHAVDVRAPIVEFMTLARLSSDPDYERLAWTMFRASTQTISKRGLDLGYEMEGEQGERVFPTNFTCEASNEKPVRGGFSRENPSWVCGYVLKTAVRLRELTQGGSPK